MSLDWTVKIKDYCNKYNIPIFYLADTLYEPKVVPMIRGIAFEFSAMILLQKILPKSEWGVDKPMMNAQIGFHDIDVRVINIRTNKVVRVECKLAKKGSFRLFPDKHSEIRVKCMRSRTLGPSKVKELSPKLKIDKQILSVHNDQYLPVDFDIVVTSIGNAFYRTDTKTGMFEWKPTKNEESFLHKLGATRLDNLKDFAFSKLYVARTKDLAISKHSGVICTRAKCKNKHDCGFIPNYPVISFNPKTNLAQNKWFPIENSLTLFESFLK